ncbi:MAG: potassium transporter TrkA [Coriobacteriia bacterium]|nr:potassium transporter TrkA [Coriobacteriia bacterium]
MKRITLRQRIQYRFDKIMSRGTPAMLLALFGLSLTIVFSAALFVRLTRTAPSNEGFGLLLWKAGLRTLDPGTMGGDSGPWAYLFAMLFVTVGGIFVISALIGIISNGLNHRIEELRKGRSLVVENDHTLILGWCPQVFTIISELVVANANRKTGAAIVVLAEEDKVVMEDAIRAQVPETGNTSVICRSGNPIDMVDLEIGNPHSARAVIVLPTSEDPDTNAIKVVLALAKNPNRKDGPYHVVTQVSDPRSSDVMRMVGSGDRMLSVLSSDLIARVIAQTSRQCGLSVVYSELLDFGGDEVYFADAPALTGRSYGELLSAYENSAVIGIQRADASVHINPQMDALFESGDRVIAIAQDDDRFTPSIGPGSEIPADAIRCCEMTEPAPERALILGWNVSGPAITHELDAYVSPGSSLTVVSRFTDVEEQIMRSGGELVNQKLTVLTADIRNREMLEQLEAAGYDHVIVLAYRDLGAQAADAITLVTLLHLRDIADRDKTTAAIVSEMLDMRNRDLAEVAKVDDFIVSEHLTSLMMAQLSENADLDAVFEQLFDHGGSELTLKPAGDYISCEQPVDFYTIVESARRRGETAIGFRIRREARDASVAYGVHTNPLKSEQVQLCCDDRIIVLAEH